MTSQATIGALTDLYFLNTNISQITQNLHSHLRQKRSLSMLNDNYRQLANSN